MSDHIYQVVNIEGKDLGCIASKSIKRGTLISQEKPQCIASGRPWDPDWIKSVALSFDQMSARDQEKYLKLHNSFNDIESLNDLQKKELLDRKDKIDKAFNFGDSKGKCSNIHNILNIYGTNAYENGLGIETAMFNHSCNSNAEAVWIEDSKISTIRARLR